MDHFADRLIAAIRRVGNPVLVGIDPRPEDMPPGWLDRYPPTRGGVAEAFKSFAAQVLDVVAGRVAAVKFQAAYYEAYGPEGMSALAASARLAREKGLIVIIDGKRNDIGSTAEAYARAYLGRVKVGDGLELRVGGRCAHGQSLPGPRWCRALFQRGGGVRQRSFCAGPHEQPVSRRVSGPGL